MSSDNAKIDKKKVALSVQTYDKLKTFSRFNALKPRMIIDSMVDLMLQDEELAKRVIEATREKEPNKAE